MFRDIKLNSMQYTAQKLENLLEKYHQYTAYLEANPKEEEGEEEKASDEPEGPKYTGHGRKYRKHRPKLAMGV